MSPRPKCDVTHLGPQDRSGVALRGGPQDSAALTPTAGVAVGTGQRRAEGKGRGRAGGPGTAPRVSPAGSPGHALFPLDKT